MRFRKLRIAWSGVCGIACLLLIVLWVRSYWWCEMIYYHPTLVDMHVFRSDEGEISYGNWFFRATTMGSPPKIGLTLRTGRLFDDGTGAGFGGSEVPNTPLFNRVFRGFRRTDGLHYPGYLAPYWFVMLVVAMFGSLPWFIQRKWRFTLRTLLIATTLVAVVLGLIVWAVRK
jgi:hypothetical protein